MRTGSFSPGPAVRRRVGQFLAAAAMIGMADIGASLAAEDLPRAQQRTIPADSKARAAFQPRGPAQFFTINEVLANAGSSARTIRLSIDDNEPFGLTTFVLPEGVLWSKWRKVESDTALEDRLLQRCIGEAQHCTPAAARFGAIVTGARRMTGRARLEFVNQRINSGIRYMHDDEQWGVPDLWSTPLTTFATGFGDCEDYVIAKYVALRESGVPPGDLQMVLGHDRNRMSGHAVLAVRDEGRWLFLDHLTAHPLAAFDMRNFVPLFSFDARGVSLLATPYIGRSMAKFAG